MSISWSNFQEDIFDFGVSPEHDGENGMVQAVAGSGKTTTLVEFTKRVKGSTLLMAFNRHIAEELGRKLKGDSSSECKTAHAIGRAAFGSRLGNGVRIYVDGRKGWDLGKKWAEDNFADETSDRKFHLGKDLSDMHNLMRLNLIAPDDIEAIDNLAVHHGIDDGVWKEGIPWIFKASNELAENAGVIDFTDMIYLPNVYECTFRRSMWTLIDEAQDLSPAQLGIALQTVIPNFGRVVAVGDERQAIYGFAGADANSFQNIKARIGATDLPLSICYRCPTSHLDIIRPIVPQILPRPNAPVGYVEDVKYSDMPDLVRGNDLILCRVTAPLVKLCIKLIRARIPASVRGRDIGKQITSLVKKVGNMPGFTYSDFLRFLEVERMQQMDFYRQKQVSEGTVEAFIDKVEAIEVCYAEAGANDIKGLCNYIESLFSDERKMVWLSTIHRAKGLENDRVFILKPEKLPLEWRDQKPWEYTQEMNLRYVAHTRATESLFYIKDDLNEAGGSTRHAMEL